MIKIAGLDIGTTGCKCLVFDENGTLLDHAYQDYPVQRTLGHQSVNATAIMEGVYAVLAKIGSRHPDIAGIGVTSFGETFVLTDSNGIPLYNAMLYTDPHGAKEKNDLVAALGESHITEITGLRPHEMYSISKIMWLKHHHPEIWQKSAYIFLIEDYVVYMLSGIRQIDYSLATRTMAFDIKKLTWSHEILTAADVKESMFSHPVPSGTLAGPIRPEVAQRTGLSHHTKIVSISHDQVSAAIGAHGFTAGMIVDGAGTVECMTPIFDSIPDLSAMANSYFAVVPYVIPGKYVAYAFSYTGGALIQWCVNTLAAKAKDEAIRQGISVNKLLEDASSSPTGLLILPHFDGAATPYMDTESKGAIIGLTTATTIADIYRGCLEGVVYEMMVNAEALARAGCRFSCMNATGGGAHSEVWLQMKADALNIPVTALETVDAGTVGSAMLTGIAIGIFKNLSDAADIMIHKRKTYYPRPWMHEKYQKIYKRYRGVYSAIRPLLEDAPLDTKTKNKKEVEQT